jgi:hypothetical protein
MKATESYGKVRANSRNNA